MSILQSNKWICEFTHYTVASNELAIVSIVCSEHPKKLISVMFHDFMCEINFKLCILCFKIYSNSSLLYILYLMYLSAILLQHIVRNIINFPFVLQSVSH